MNFGKSSILLDHAESCGVITILAACVLIDESPNAASKLLARLTGSGRLVKVPFIGARCYWHPRRPLGAQGLILASSVLYRCVLAEPRLWMPVGREGAATLIACPSEREALFVDYGASPRHVAGKLGRWCNSRDTAGLAALGVVVPTEAKARAINAAAENLPLPVRFTISDELRSLTCERARH